MSEKMVTVMVSAAMARQRFNGCDPEYIRTTCHASCCQSSVEPSGILVSIHPDEIGRIRRRGGKVVRGRLQPVNRKCPFKTGLDLCALHDTRDKPFGCIASPFTLNSNMTLVVRNRYRLLKCYEDGRKLPAYKAFATSLVLLFGAAEAARITKHLDEGGGDVPARMPARKAAKLLELDEIKQRTKFRGASK